MSPPGGRRRRRESPDAEGISTRARACLEEAGIFLGTDTLAVDCGGRRGVVLHAVDRCGTHLSVHLLDDVSPAHRRALAARMEALRTCGAGQACARPVGLVDTGEGTLAWVCELVEGVSLARLLQQRPVLGRAWTLAILGDLAGALGTVHAAGVVHGDICPDNVVVRPDGHAVLIDLDGTACAGTVPWAAPELDGGEPASAASDVYALAALARTMVSQAPVTAAALAPTLVGALDEDPARRPQARELARRWQQLGPAAWQPLSDELCRQARAVTAPSHTPTRGQVSHPSARRRRRDQERPTWRGRQGRQGRGPVAGRAPREAEVADVRRARGAQGTGRRRVPAQSGRGRLVSGARLGALSAPAWCLPAVVRAAVRVGTVVGVLALATAGGWWVLDQVTPSDGVGTSRAGGSGRASVGHGRSGAPSPTSGSTLASASVAVTGRVPPPGSTSAPVGTPAPPHVSMAHEEIGDVVASLAARRDQALMEVDEQELASVSVDGSPAQVSDLAVLDALVESGERVVDLHTTVTVLGREQVRADGSVRVRVRRRQEASVRVGQDGVRREVPAQEAQVVWLVLERSPWRVREVTAG